MKPGDFIEWTYKGDGSVVDVGEMLWSTPMQRWVPIGGLNLLVGFVEGTITWFCDKGLFHARVDDALPRPYPMPSSPVVPRARG